MLSPAVQMERFFWIASAVLTCGHAFQDDVVCVTGAGGFVATELVKQLLESGYNVRGTVRSLKNTARFEHLTKLDEALPGTLQLMEADSLRAGSFDDCAMGAKYVFHTASPVEFVPKDAKKEVIDPAVEGARHIMQSAAKGGVKRVVFTGSIAAILSLTEQDKPVAGDLFTEADWNTVSESLWTTTPNGVVDGVPHAYMASKVISERVMWQLSKELGVDLVVILPSGVLGSVYSKRIEGFSAPVLKGALEGGVVPFDGSWVDNRDVAKAHIAAAIRPEAAGRYVASQPGQVPKAYVSKVLFDNWPQLELPAPEGPQDIKPWINNTKFKSLIGDLVPLEESLLDMARSMLSAGLADVKLRRSEL